MRININEFSEAELAALRAHQQKIQTPDKDKRRRAVKEYRVFLDYLERIGRITPEEKTHLECMRIEGRHV